MKRKTPFFLLLLVFFAPACQKYNVGPSPVPWVSVNTTIDYSTPLYSALSSPGGYLYLVNVGYKGIIVLQNNDGTFHAYDRTCPYHVKSSCGVVLMSIDGSGILCGSYSGTNFNACCASEYAFDGSVVSGPSKFSLKAYTVKKTGTVLTITN
jgi:hypothetical protein